MRFRLQVFRFRVKSLGFRIVQLGVYRVMQRQMRLCSDIPGYTGVYSGLYVYT